MKRRKGLIATLICTVFMFLQIAPSGGAVQLGLTMEQQKGPQWCWAACTQALIRYATEDPEEHGNIIQEGIFLIAKGLGDFPEDCGEQNGTVEEMQRAVNVLLPNKRLHLSSVLDDVGALELEIRNELLLGNPVMLRKCSGGHWVIIVGFDDENQERILYKDPLHGDEVQVMPFKELIGNGEIFLDDFMTEIRARLEAREDRMNVLEYIFSQFPGLGTEQATQDFLVQAFLETEDLNTLIDFTRGFLAQLTSKQWDIAYIINI